MSDKQTTESMHPQYSLAVAVTRAASHGRVPVREGPVTEAHGEADREPNSMARLRSKRAADVPRDGPSSTKVGGPAHSAGPARPGPPPGRFAQLQRACGPPRRTAGGLGRDRPDRGSGPAVMRQQYYEVELHGPTVEQLELTGGPGSASRAGPGRAGGSGRRSGVWNLLQCSSLVQSD